MPLKPPAVKHVSIRQHSTVVLTEINTLFHESVTVDREGGDGNSTATELDALIDFYRIETNCKDIMTETDVVQSHSVIVYFTNKNISRTTPVYALKGSTFEYQISGAISQERLVKVCVYNGPDYDSGTEFNCKKVSINGGEGHFTVPDPDYYFFKVETPDDDIQYTLSVTETLKILDMNRKSYLGCGINAASSHCQFNFTQNGKLCLIAEFFQSKNDMPRVMLEVKVQKSRVKLMLILPLALVTFLFLTILMCLVILVCCCCARILKLYKNSTVV